MINRRNFFVKPITNKIKAYKKHLLRKLLKILEVLLLVKEMIMQLIVY